MVALWRVTGWSLITLGVLVCCGSAREVRGDDCAYTEGMAPIPDRSAWVLQEDGRCRREVFDMYCQPTEAMAYCLDISDIVNWPRYEYCAWNGYFCTGSVNDYSEETRVVKQTLACMP